MSLDTLTLKRVVALRARRNIARVFWLLAVAWVTAGWATPPSNLEMSEITGPCASIAAPETSAIQASLTGFFARNDSLAVSI